MNSGAGRGVGRSLPPRGHTSCGCSLDQPNPVQRALGAEAAQKANQRRQALITRTENAVYRYVPDLSYGAPAKPK